MVQLSTAEHRDRESVGKPHQRADQPGYCHQLEQLIGRVMEARRRQLGRDDAPDQPDRKARCYRRRSTRSDCAGRRTCRSNSRTSRLPVSSPRSRSGSSAWGSLCSARSLQIPFCAGMTVRPMSPCAGHKEVHAEEAPQFCGVTNRMAGFQRTASMASASVIQASCQGPTRLKFYILQTLAKKARGITKLAHRMENLRFAQLLCDAQ